MNELDEKIYEQFEIKQELVKVEEDFMEMTVNNIEYAIEERKKELVSQVENFITEYAEFNDKGVMKIKTMGSLSLVVSEYFFKPIIPVIGCEPKYNAEKMAIVFDLYRQIISEINSNIGKFIPNKTHYCRFCGISSKTYDNYMKNADIRLQNIMLMIDDYLLDANLTSSQNREVDNVTTIFRAKVEQNKQEQPTQQTLIVAENVDISTIKQRVNRITELNESSEKR